jgi:DNA-binding response OmpR family regulator
MSRKVLIVEDEEDIATAMSDRLESWGFDTTLAYSGQAGLDLLIDTWPDLVLLDIRLPDRDGLRVLAEMREKSVAIPIIVVSASHGPGIEQKAIEAGATDFILKPYEPEDLRRKIENALSQVE